MTGSRTLADSMDLDGPDPARLSTVGKAWVTIAKYEIEVGSARVQMCKMAQSVRLDPAWA